ncbi:MAG: ChaN family lipoprotein [Natronohydrobacter sp.]|nr:ChaN family lipoprotein [Natronohydrobacter sp.]
MILRTLAAATLALPAVAAEITPDALDTLPQAQVIYLGEVHDNPLHHIHQTRATAAIAPTALILEMLTEEQAATIPAPLPDQDTLAALLDWDNSGWPDFAMYYPILKAAPQAAIYGAALPRDAARASLQDGIAAHFPGDPARFGLDTPLDPDDQATREAHQARAHCDALPEHLLPGMVAIQRLRDALLAEAALRAHTETGGPVVVITGTEHARTDIGAPLKLARAAPDLTQLSIGQFEFPQDTAPPHDLWLVTDPHPRPDPCAAFR